MLVLKPGWVHHEDNAPIYALHCHPDGQRLATAGEDHRVRIWNLRLLRDPELEANGSLPRSLAVLSDHFGPVNCVRWAFRGNLLASCGDDKLIHVYEIRTGPGAAVFGSSEKPNIENWKLAITLHGHTADVVDLAWSPDDKYVASCSMDNTVRVWLSATGGAVAVLEGHTSLVKGVAWDPIDSFLASAADDKTVRIWRTHEWQPVTTIQGPYDKSVGATFFRRLGWSPCGSLLTTTNAFSAPQHTAAIIKRADWSKSYDFVGHSAPVTAVRYNHTMFCRPGSEAKGAEGLYHCVALGSQDCKVTVWVTDRPQPLFVGKHFFTHPVVDLSWSPDGYALLACSSDGSVAAFIFSEEEIGVPLAPHQMDALKRERYGDTAARQVAVVESPALLALEQQAACAQPPRPSDRSSGNGSGEPLHVPPSPIAPSPPVAASFQPPPQKEVRRADGRRRIIPQPLGATPAQTSGEAEAGVGQERGGGGADVAREVRLMGLEGGRVLVPQREPGGGVVSIQVRGEEGAVWLLEASSPQGGATMVLCSRGGVVEWRDRLPAAAHVLAGNRNLWAVATRDSALQVYTPKGRRSLPTLLLPSPASFMTCDEGRQLLVVTSGGEMLLWDLQRCQLVLSASVAPLLHADPQSATQGLRIASVRLSRSGAPLLLLSSGTAFLFHLALRVWCQVAHNSFPASHFASTWPSALQGGEIASLHAAAGSGSGSKRKAGPGLAPWLVSRGGAEEGWQTRVQVEDSMAAAVVMESVTEYRHWLLAYVRHLTREGDEKRLREICEDFLGGSEADTILGLDKRDLLRSEVLPSMAANRTVHRLVNEILDRLADIEEEQVRKVIDSTTLPSDMSKDNNQGAEQP